MGAGAFIPGNGDAGNIDQIPQRVVKHHTDQGKTSQFIQKDKSFGIHGKLPPKLSIANSGKKAIANYKKREERYFFPKNFALLENIFELHLELWTRIS